MIPDFMPEKLIISFEEYLDTVEKLSVEITNNFKPTVLVGIMRGAAPVSYTHLTLPTTPYV